MMQGWWGSEATARGMIPVWVGSWGELPDGRLLVDEESGETLTEWPDRV